MPLIKDLMEIKKSKLRAYFQLARTSFSLDNLDPEEKLLAFMRDKASIDDVDSVLTTLFLAKGNPYFHLPRHGTLKAMNKHYAEMAYCMFQR